MCCFRAAKLPTSLEPSAAPAAKPPSVRAAQPMFSPKPPRGAPSCLCCAPWPWSCARIRPSAQAVPSSKRSRSPPQSPLPQRQQPRRRLRRPPRPHPQQRHQRRSPTRSLVLKLPRLRNHHPRQQRRNPTRNRPLNRRRLRSPRPRPRKNRNAVLWPSQAGRLVFLNLKPLV